MTPEREKALQMIDLAVGDTSTIAEEEEGEVIGNGKPSPPVSAGAVVINVLSSPTGREESIPPQSAPDRTNADPVS